MTAVVREGRGPTTIRLTFEYDDGALRVVARQRLHKRALPSDPVTGYDGQQGAWVELRAPDQRTLYRRIIHDPFSPHLEVFAHDPERPIVRVRANRRGGTFVF